MVDLNDTTSDWYLADCDGDGVINGTEVDPDGDGIVGPNTRAKINNSCGSSFIPKPTITSTTFNGTACPSSQLLTQNLRTGAYNGEYHAYNPDVVKSLQQAVVSGNYEDYKVFSALVNDRSPAHLRDLLGFNFAQQSIDIDEVESAQSLYSRFDTAAMSMGSLSPEAHEALAIAMNRLGGQSNSGEGGEDPARFNTEKNSKIKPFS